MTELNFNCDSFAGVQSAAVNVICELARKNPKNYLSLAPIFFKLMTTSTNNWMLIKIIKLVSRSVRIRMCSKEHRNNYPISVTRKIEMKKKMNKSSDDWLRLNRASVVNWPNPC